MRRAWWPTGMLRTPRCSASSPCATLIQTVTQVIEPWLDPAHVEITCTKNIQKQNYMLYCMYGYIYIYICVCVCVELLYSVINGCETYSRNIYAQNGGIPRRIPPAPSGSRKGIQKGDRILAVNQKRGDAWLMAHACIDDEVLTLAAWSKTSLKKWESEEWGLPKLLKIVCKCL